MSLTRRGFLSALASIPVIGALFARDTEPAWDEVPEYVPVTDAEEQATFRGIMLHYENYPVECARELASVRLTSPLGEFAEFVEHCGSAYIRGNSALSERRLLQ